MNKRYIDFVPKKSATAKKVVPKKTMKATLETKQPKTVKAKVEKTKVEKVISAPEPVRETKVVTRTVVEEKTEVKKLKLPSSKLFINTEKVEKRPLSRNVYKPKKIVVTPKEEPKGTVTIIEKPEKDSKMGLVVTIIITIILGAAAGTVAFLLLPK